MQRYIIRRFIFSLFAIWATMTVTFVFMRLLPGDPVTTLVGEEGDPSQIEAIKARLGLDQPVPIQYFFYLRSLATLDLGESIYKRLPVNDLMAQALPRTISLSIVSFVVGVAIGLPGRNHLRHKALFDLGSRCDSNRVPRACHALVSGSASFSSSSSACS